MTVVELDPRAREELERLRERGRIGIPSPRERRAIRVRAGVAVDELANAVGVSTGAIYCWETGWRNPSRRHRQRYLTALRVLEGEE